MPLFPDKKVAFTEDSLSIGQRIWRGAAEMIQVALIVTAIVLPIRYFLVQPFYVKGASMEPNFEDHEYLIIDELSYRLRAPERGEIAVFRYPNDPSQYFIKRIIALPGETVTVSGGKIFVASPDGKAMQLDESSYLAPGVVTSGDKKVALGPDQYFVLGDNRPNSLDSRIFGTVPKKNIVGRVMLRGWPLDKVTWYEVPNYN